jgi:Raf kinase inhibitor-like YbhB/YbcL family protein
MNMKRIFFVLPFLTLFVTAGSAEEASKGVRFVVSSPVFENNGTIPKKFGCDGENVNPPLRIENVPPGTQSIALIFDDIDAPRSTYVHWILWDIDPGTKEIRENSIPGGAVQGMNDFKKQNYGGPCPPTRPHRYVFKVYTLDTVLSLNPVSTRPDLEKAMKGHVLGEAQWKGTYKRK